MRSELKDNEPIDLLVISHFDEDHISGLGNLLLGKKVKRLVIPYFPLWKRLILADMANIRFNSSLFRFYLNPTVYILENFSDSFSEEGQILLLPETEDIDFPLNPDRQGRIEFQDLNEKAIHHNKVKLLKGYGYLHHNVVEFIFYNAPLSELKKYPSDFKQYQEEIEKITQLQQYGKAEINKLKAICDKYFVRTDSKGKKNSKDRNVISLFLYVGYIENIKQAAQIKYFQHISLFEDRKSEGIYSKAKGVREEETFYDLFSGHNQKISYRNSILYTGDGSLNKPSQFEHLKLTLGDKRIQNIFCFQVLHHGSRNNWHKGLADKIQPCISVFSADPNYANYRHPHAEVVKDFLPYSPILVNQNSYITFNIL
nr:hypothetical protein [Rodentibacter rarus]